MLIVSGSGLVEQLVQESHKFLWAVGCCNWCCCPSTTLEASHAKAIKPAASTTSCTNPYLQPLVFASY